MNHFVLEVSGALALFTRPEFKVERLSYEVITPSAARAIFEAIYWRPQMRWQIKEIAVLNPISFTHFKRCETAAEAHIAKTEIFADRTRQIRSSVVLRDVKYRITAEIKLNGEWLMMNGELRDKELARHCAAFRRRAMKGQCFTQPYLGCREFACDWRLLSDEWLMRSEELEPPISETRDLGRMLYDMDFTDPKHPKPIFFDAKMIDGVLRMMNDEW
ncbi:MAG: type I-C CRISPR-associated protein Cas5c [Rikenellaceae bacterium]